MSRYIDADALYETLCHLWDKSDSEDFEKGVFRIVINASRIDIVRCSECKYGRNIESEWICEHLSGMAGLNVLVNADDYCSYGERREQ